MGGEWRGGIGYIRAGAGVAFRLHWPGLEWGELGGSFGEQRRERGEERIKRGCEERPNRVGYEGARQTPAGGEDDDGRCQPPRRRIGPENQTLYFPHEFFRRMANVILDGR